MDTNELLNGLKQRDPEAYLQLTQKYGWKLYSHLREQFDSREMADAAFNETLNAFYNSIAGGNGDDAVETLLMAYADLTCRNMHKRSDVAGQVPEDSSIQIPKNTRQSQSGNFGFSLGVGILALGIIAALWVILGLLMDMNILPALDLGYSWFNANIAPWF